MSKTSPSSSGGKGWRQQCPCGDGQCYIQVEEDQEDGLVEQPSEAWEQKPSLGTSQTTPGDPYVGQSFQSDDEALEYYTNFARNNGFSVRRERSKGNPEHPYGIYRRELVCHRAGAPLPRKSEEGKRQTHKKSRCQCEARMVIKKNVASGFVKWVVIKFTNVHNHELMDSNEVHSLACHRYIPTHDRERILALAKAGCSINLILKSLEVENGVKPGHLGFKERDIKNFLDASNYVNRDEVSDLLRVCKCMKDKNLDFRYEYKLDDNNKLEHIAWSYVDSIRAYAVFGDIVVFDTSFRLSSYDKLVGVFLGVDNHGHSIFFGCVLLQDDTPCSYGWALQAFIRLMDGKLPRTILSDLHIGLKDAISSVLPSTKHVIPIWHIMSKLSSWFSASLGSQYERFKSEFQKLSDIEVKEEFEYQWGQMVTEFGLTSDRHINLLFSHLSYWANPHLGGCFFGGLTTTGQLMSTKSFFRGFLSSRTRLKDFLDQVGVAIDFQNQAAEAATMQESDQDIKIKTCFPIEEHASTILTQHAFEMFQKELLLSTQYAALETSRESYLVRHHLKSEGGHVVSFIPLDEEIHCSCKGFESSGILCRHALRVLSVNNCFALPEKYLLTRWRRESSLFPTNNGYKYRSQALRSLASIIVQEASMSDDRFSYIQGHLSSLLSHVRDMPATEEATSVAKPSSLFDATLGIIPAISASRGRPRKFKSAAERRRPAHAKEMTTMDEAASDFNPSSSFDATQDNMPASLINGESPEEDKLLLLELHNT